ncbi:MAG TPA: endolytic transglycosylase MltG, partial [Candidatus Paceibacterota bacterium]|nr:endolytic transglycosylase MltG [Candidatus Paceibacterota bacterium]
MDDFKKELEKAFETMHRTIATLSTHWREHTNRRTIIITVVVGIIAILAYVYVIQPPDSFPTDELVSVSQGQSVSQIANSLYEDGVIRSPLAFRIIVTILGRERELHAGDYLFKQPEDIFTVAHAVAVGAYGLEPLRIRIPEGANTAQ